MSRKRNAQRLGGHKDEPTKIKELYNDGPRKMRKGRKVLILALNVPRKLACPES